MSQRSPATFFLSAAALLAAYAIIFPLLTVDTLSLIFARAAAFETRNLVLIVFMELSRLVTSVVAIGIAVVLMVRARDRSDARALAMFCLFATIAYEKVFGSNGYPGPVQERVTIALTSAGVSPDVLAWLFGPLAWAVWPAAAALLRFSAVFPHELNAEVLDTSGQQDRRGMLRSKGLAGTDIGAFFRGLSKYLVMRRAFRVAPLAVASLLMIVVHTVVRGSNVAPLLWIPALTVLAVVVTNIRAAYAVAQDADRVRITWIILAGVIGLFMFLTSAATLVVVPSVFGRMLAFVLIMLIPAVVMVCLALAVLARADLDSRGVIDQTTRGGTIVLAVIVSFGMVYTALGLITDRLGMSRALAGLGAAIVAVLAFGLVKASADRLRLRILERS